MSIRVLGGGGSGSSTGAIAATTISNSSARNVATVLIPTAGGTTAGLASHHVVCFYGVTTETYTLPTNSLGRVIIVKNKSTGIVTVAPDGSDTIDDGPAAVQLAAGDCVTLVGTGADWMVIT